MVEYGLLKYSRRLDPFPFVSSFSEENLYTTYGSGGYYGSSAIHFRSVDRSGFHRCCLQFLANFNLRPFCVEMSFSLLSPLIWVICSLVQALEYPPAGFFFHSGLTIIYRWQTESLTARTRVHYHRELLVINCRSSLTERDFDLPEQGLISYKSRLA